MPALVGLALLLSGCAASGARVAREPSSDPDATEPQAARPTYILGDRWIRNDGIWEIIRIEADRYVFSASTGEEFHLTRDLALAHYWQYGRAVVQFTPAPRIDWPLAVGRQSTVTGKFTALHGDPYDADLRWVVEAYEDITVPAGTFKAFRIAYTVTPRRTTDFGPRWGWAGAPPVGWNYRFWYAPEARQIVKSDGNQSKIRFEVVAIDPGEAEPLRVDIQGPEDQARLAPDSTPTLVGKVAGGKGVASVTVTVNGDSVFRDESQGEPKRTVVLNVGLPLRDGKNVVLVTASDVAGTTSQEARTVFYTAPLAVRLPSPGQALRVPSEHISLTVPVPPATADAVVNVLLNGVVVDYFRADPARTPVYDVRMKLTEGKNDISIRYLGGLRIPFPNEDRTIILDRSTSVAALPPAVDLSGADARRQVEQERRHQQERQQRTEAEQRRLEEERRVAEERQRREGEQHRAEEQRLAEQLRLAEEQRLAQEAQRLAEEKRRLADERRVAEERGAAEAQRRDAEAQRLAEEKRRGEEQQRLAAERHRQAEQRRLASLPPLRVTLSSPSDQARVENESVALAGIITAGRGVSRVVLSLNGVEIGRQYEPAPRQTIALNQPLRLREGQNTLVVTATEADGTISQEVRTVFFERPTPLSVEMRYPQDQTRVTDAASVAAAVVSSSKGVAKVSVVLNGIEVHQQTERTPQTLLLVTTPIRLQPGLNVVAVSATDRAGRIRQEVRTVHFETAPVAAVTPPLRPVPAPAHERWAVVIGVGQYDHSSIPRLRYSVADAEAIYQTLIDVAGFSKDKVLLLTDKSERKPTLKNIKWALGTFLARSARKNDTVLIFFAGHGAPETDPRGLERDGLAKYLIPSDADADDLYSSALPMDELQIIFGRIEAERVVAFLDACYSGAAGGRTFSSRKTRAAAIDDLFIERLTRSKGRAIITASRPTEVSIELPELGHGIFSYYLVNGLKGAADLNRDGIISLQELYEYLEQQVTGKSRSVGGNQHPVMKGELEGVFPLVRTR
jgi:hypothetical protein